MKKIIQKDRKYFILYSKNGIPYSYCYKNYKSFIAMLNFMIKNYNLNNYDYVKPQLIIQWNSQQEVLSNNLSGNILTDGLQIKKNTQIMENSPQQKKTNVQLSLNL